MNKTTELLCPHCGGALEPEYDPEMDCQQPWIVHCWRCGFFCERYRTREEAAESQANKNETWVKRFSVSMCTIHMEKSLCASGIAFLNRVFRQRPRPLTLQRGIEPRHLSLDPSVMRATKQLTRKG